MPDEMIIAHQLAPKFAEQIAAALPPGIGFVGLPPDHAYDLPDKASVLLAVPPRRPIVVPTTKPANWPGTLRWVQAVSVGVDEFPGWLHEVEFVTCGRGLNNAPIAEFVMASLLAGEKHFPDIWIDTAARWRHRDLGTLEGKTLGLVGYGSIGQAIARRALPFGLTVLATRRSNAPSGIDGVTVASLETVLKQSDFLVLCAALTPETRHIIGRDALALVKPNLHLVNIARGGLIDQAALLEALDQHRLHLASLDVTEPEPLPEGHAFYTHPRIHLSPHLCWTGRRPGETAAAGIIGLFIENLRRFRAGEELLERVSRETGY